MLAADLLADANLLLPANVAGTQQVAALSPAVSGEGADMSVGGTAANNFIGGVVVPAPGTIYVDPPAPPELGAVLENGVLKVTGSHDPDHIFIYASEGTLYVREVVKNLTLFSMPYGQIVLQPGGVFVGHAALVGLGSSLNSILVHGNGGDDWITVDESISTPATLHGDWGNDTLQGGSGGDNLYGGAGNDELLGRGGNDLLEGGHGDDLLVGGDGNDVIYGGAGSDYLVGGNGNDWLMGEDGDDQLFGEAGNDMLFGGPGQNLMDGGAGDDHLYGGDGIDAMYGGDGNDFIRGFGGNDRIRGEGGDDYIIGDEGDDIVDGGDGNDQIAGDLGNDVIYGGNGHDVIGGGHDQDWIDGGAGDDNIHGGAGNDWIMGSSGSDQLDGGSGDNKVYQSRPDGYVQLGTTTQALSWGDVGDFFGDVWDGLVGVFNWTLDKAITIGTRLWDWASHIDDRLIRLGGDLAGALSNWPWEADFWKGLGRSLVDILEVIGLGEAWEIAFEILKPWQRGMTSQEIDLARSVFGNSIPYDRVRLDEFSLMAGIGRTHVTGYIINSTENLDDRTLIHELTHVWQYVQDGLVYIPEAIGGQASDEGYDFGGLSGLEAKLAAGKGLSAFNPEQQGNIVATYFDRRNAARGYEAIGGYAPAELRHELDVYIHFVKEVSTLTPGQLDTPDPPFSLPGQGDFNGDMIVNIADHILWRNSEGQNVTPLTGADGTGDGVVDWRDRELWKANFGRRITLPPADPPTPPWWPGTFDPVFDGVFVQLASDSPSTDTTSTDLVDALAVNAATQYGQAELLLHSLPESRNTKTDAMETVLDTTTYDARSTKSLDLALAMEL